MQTLELSNYGAIELSSTEMVNVDGGEIVNGYSDKSARKAGESLTSFFGGLWDGFYGAIKNCNC